MRERLLKINFSKEVQKNESERQWVVAVNLSLVHTYVTYLTPRDTLGFNVRGYEPTKIAKGSIITNFLRRVKYTYSL